MTLPQTSEISHHHKVTNITMSPTSLSPDGCFRYDTIWFQAKALEVVSSVSFTFRICLRHFDQFRQFSNTEFSDSVKTLGNQEHSMINDATIEASQINQQLELTSSFVDFASRVQFSSTKEGAGEIEIVFIRKQKKNIHYQSTDIGNKKQK